MERLLTVAEARQILGGVSHQTIYRALARGDLACVKVGDRTLFRPRDLEEFVARKVRRRTSDGDPAPPVAA